MSLTLLIASCGGGGGGGGGSSSGGGGTAGGPPPTACVDRAQLCADELLNSGFARLTDNRYYLPLPGSGNALHAFEGTLQVTADRMSMTAGETSGLDFLPRFGVRFITVDDRLVPLSRNIIFGAGNDQWNIILSPGLVWSEQTDQGMSRASFPFTLVTHQWNEAHNGVATFLYDDTGVSQLRYQVTQETAEWNKTDMWGVTAASYQPGTVADPAARRDEWLEEMASRVEVKTWPQLQADYPDANLNAFTRGIDKGEISGTAIIVDDTIYYQPAATRYGNYPYPLEMRHGVFSVTKSAGAALTMLRLAEKYGDGVFDLFVGDYLEIEADHNGWVGVTFGHLLNMAAGIGDNAPDPNAAATFADENDNGSSTWQRLWNTYPRDPKLTIAFEYGNYPWDPGQIVRYNTAHTYILGAAMDAFYKTMAGPDASIWEMMRDEVYDPIGVRFAPMIETLDQDALPIYGFGFFLNAFDTARISQLLDRDGVYDGQAILHTARTQRSLYKTGDQGLSTYVTAFTQSTQPVRYLDSFWSYPLTGPGGCQVQVPYMWGFGGNFVVLLKNGVIAYRYADADVHDPGALGVAAATIRPIC